jgi:hypothetical protein
MNKLLAEIIDAHGGAAIWRDYAKIDATIVSGGGFFALKGFPQDPRPRRMTVWLHEQHASVTPYGAGDASYVRTFRARSRLAATFRISFSVTTCCFVDMITKSMSRVASRLHSYHRSTAKRTAYDFRLVGAPIPEVLIVDLFWICSWSISTSVK